MTAFATHSWFATFAAMILAVFCWGQPELDFESANAEYEAGNYAEALRGYEEILQQHRHFESEFNAGNAAFKLGQLGVARLHYERAKLLEPFNENLKANLDLLEAKIVDRITPIPNLGLKSWLSTWVGPGQLVGWTLWALFWWTMAWVLWGLRWTKDQPASKTTLTFLGASALVLGIAGIWGMQESNASMQSPQQLVIMVDRVDITSAPSETSTVLFQLHEGTKACILDKTSDWSEIELANGNVGWVPNGAVEDV